MPEQLFIHDAGGLFVHLDPSTKQVTHRGNLDRQLTDVGFTDDGRLYGIDFGNLYSVDPYTGTSTLVSRLPTTGANGLAMFDADTALITSNTGDFIVLNTQTGQTESSGPLPGGMVSAGDIAAYRYGDTDQAGGWLLSAANGNMIRMPSDLVDGWVVHTHNSPDFFALAASSDNSELFAAAGSRVFMLDAKDLEYRDVNTGELTDFGGPATLLDLSGEGFSEIWGASSFNLGSKDNVSVFSSLPPVNTLPAVPDSTTLPPPFKFDESTQFFEQVGPSEQSDEAEISINALPPESAAATTKIIDTVPHYDEIFPPP